MSTSHFHRNTLLGLTLLSLNPGTAFSAQSHRAPLRTFSLDSGYAPMVATNPSMWNLWTEWEGLGSAGFDLVSDKTFVGGNIVTRFLWEITYSTGWWFVSYPFFVANHELGHGSRSVAAGLTPTYSWNNAIRHPTIFSFIGEGFIRYGSGANTTSGGATRAQPTDWFTTIMAAAGMNNSQLFAEHLEDRATRDVGHINEAIAYFRSKTDAYFYARVTAGGGATTGDVANLISYWQAQGLNVSTSDFETGSLVSQLASFTTYAYVWGILRYFGTGDATVHTFHTFHLGPVKAPDISFFLNRTGLSYRLRSELRFSSFSIPFGLEYVYKGQATAELSVGLKQ